MRFVIHRMPVLLMGAFLGLSALGDERGLDVIFADVADGFAVTGVVNRAAGAARFLSAGSNDADFWELEFWAKEGGSNAVCRVTNRTPCRQRLSDWKDGTRAFIWKGVDLPEEPSVLDVRAELKYAEDGLSADWTIQTANHSMKWALAVTRYPYLRRVLSAGEGDALVPEKNLGARFIRGFDAAKLPVLRGYPGWRPMVTAFQKGTSGLYLAAHDPEARIKALRYLKDGSCFFETPVENAGVVGMAANGPKYPVRMAAYAGDWWVAAKIYRKWAIRQKWCAKGPIAKRADYPKAMSDTAIWGLLYGAPNQVTNLMKRIRACWPDVKVGFRWYCWNVQPFDTHYPEYFPCSGVDEECARGRAGGYLVMPYVNGRLWDEGLRSFQYAKGDCCTDLDGKPVIERYGRSFGVMCPYAVGWHRTLLDMGVDVVEKLGANAIYYDQISCSHPCLCYNPAHGHPLGGGTWWADGYRAALEPIHARFSKAGIPITSEGAAETWMDVVDGHLIVGRMGYSDDVPFYPAVYSGYTTYFSIHERPYDSVPALFARQAQGVLFGSVSGSWGDGRLFGNGRGPGSLAAQCKVLLTMARFRTAFVDYLAYGTLEDELRLADDVPTVMFSYAPTRRPKGRPASDVTLPYPAVFGSVWRNAEGSSVALFAANVSDELRTVRVRLPEGLSTTARAVAVPDNPVCTFVRKGGFGLLTLEPRSIGAVK